MSKNKKLNHLGIILDGNRRWARKRLLPTLEGHRRGYNKLKKVCEWCIEQDIKILSVYAFSTENWNRSKREVDYLFDLLEKGLQNDIDEMHSKNIRLKFIGQIERLPGSLRKLIAQVERKTKNNTKLLFQVCLSYGGRPEITQAIQKIIDSGAKKVTEKTIEKYLWTHGVPDPDMVIRTSGEHRLSNFLTWQSAYSELLFIDVAWPAFSKTDLKKAVSEYKKRHRRYGK